MKAEIERLLSFGLKNKLIQVEDVIPVRNSLLELLRVDEPSAEPLLAYDNETATDILERMLDYCAENALIEQNTLGFRDLMSAKIMGLLMPRQSEVIRVFRENYEVDPIMATDEFYALSQKSNYIQTDRINKNIYWESTTEYGDLEVTINLSKPEKDPKEIAAAKSAAQTNYPKCLLCLENVGFAGNINHPGRQNHRVIPISLQNSPWYFQYSPYVYYQEHCIVFKKEHVPMKLSRDSFARLLEFVDKFPHYFIGSNADLPIVGGSILTHDHFQGGRHVFPMEKALTYASCVDKEFPGVSISLVKWPMSVIRISGDNQDKLVELSMKILNAWRAYSDESCDILAYSGDTPHNTITPIARKNKSFELDLVLRNNRTTNEHQLGIFHPHSELHHIKKENIGLIEVMGLAILPGRLQEEFAGITKILTGELDTFAVESAEHVLYKHLHWIKELVEKYGCKNSSEQAEEIIKAETGKIFKRVLEDAGVFKTDEHGKLGFMRFVRSMGIGVK